MPSNGVTPDFSRTGKPKNSPFIESSNGNFQDECLNAHRFLSLTMRARRSSTGDRIAAISDRMARQAL
ncbi:integrase core domain-containing protein [Pandoraea fibrosis]|uniref:integrase core domain-containing protein n=1 Tax=Pandoraea fibrosis TaxID=1891094 RepID=UPI003522DBDA